MLIRPAEERMFCPGGTGVPPVQSTGEAPGPLGRNSQARRFLPRMAAFCVLALLIAGLPPWLASDLAAQAPQKKVKEEVEEPKTKPPAKAPKPEEEDPAKPAKPVTPLRVEDDVPAAKTSKRGKAAAPRLSELFTAAKHEPQEIRELYEQLWPPYDIVNWRTGRSAKIEPFPARITETAKYAGKAPLRTLADTDGKAVEMEFQRKDVKSIDPFELWASGRVRNFLARHTDRKSLTIEHLQAAERVLKGVLGYHESAWELAQREGDGWADVAKQVRDQLQKVQKLSLQHYADANDWTQAYEMAAELAAAYPKPEMHKEFIQPMERFVLDLLKDNVEEAQRRMLALNNIFPSNALTSRVSGELNKTADNLLQQAQAKDKEGKKDEALKLIQNGLLMSPNHPRLQNFRMKLSDQFPVLNVGIAGSTRLPQAFKPGEAFTYAELLTLDLLYESLVKPVYNPLIGQRYLPVLAADQPRLIPLGREFELVRDAFWSDGHPVLATDVRWTVESLLGHHRGVAGDNRADELQPLKDAIVMQDAFHVSLPLRRGCLDPLAHMSFKVLPDPAVHSDPKAPIGSGPFALKKSRTKDEVVFEVNDYYRRAARPGLPHIREVRFFLSTDPAKDFANYTKGTGRMHVLLDIPSQDFRNYESSLNQVNCFTLTPRRVYFLAVNHRNNLALQNKDVRRALGMAIKREDILDAVFRPKDDKVGRKLHRPLNGPFPRGSWPYDEKVNGSRADPSNPKGAENLRVKLPDAFVGAAGLKLKYPNDDPRVKRACEQIQKHIEEATGVKLVLQDMPPAQFHQEVEVEHKFELAYCHWDYANESYWLWPLFNPRAAEPGGSNYLGYVNDAELERKFHNALEYRETARVQEFMHDIHQQIFDKMPLIPLWQLDLHFAIHSSVVTAPGRLLDLDPLKLFSDIERWQLQSTR